MKVVIRVNVTDISVHSAVIYVTHINIYLGKYTMKLRSIQNFLTILLAVQLQLKLEIRSVERGICFIAESILIDRVIFQCACVKQ